MGGPGDTHLRVPNFIHMAVVLQVFCCPGAVAFPMDPKGCLSTAQRHDSCCHRSIACIGPGWWATLAKRLLNRQPRKGWHFNVSGSQKLMTCQHRKSRISASTNRTRFANSSHRFPVLQVHWKRGSRLTSSLTKADPGARCFFGLSRGRRPRYMHQIGMHQRSATLFCSSPGLPGSRLQ